MVVCPLDLTQPEGGIGGVILCRVAFILICFDGIAPHLPWRLEMRGDCFNFGVQKGSILCMD